MMILGELEVINSRGRPAPRPPAVREYEAIKIPGVDGDGDGTTMTTEERRPDVEEMWCGRNARGRKSPADFSGGR
jgi:hypothetical protein